MRKRMFLLLVVLGIVNGYCQDTLPKNYAAETTAEVVVQPKVSLMPEQMRAYLGKVKQAQFEKVVGAPVGEESGCVVYEVINTYGNAITAIRCFYRETDKILVSVTFGTPHYLGYWFKFTDLAGFNKKNSHVVTEYGEITKVELSVGGFGCQILDIMKISPHETTAIINYHITK